MFREFERVARSLFMLAGAVFFLFMFATAWRRDSEEVASSGDFHPLSPLGGSLACIGFGVVIWTGRIVLWSGSLIVVGLVLVLTGEVIKRLGSKEKPRAAAEPDESQADVHEEPAAVPDDEWVDDRPGAAREISERQRKWERRARIAVRGALLVGAAVIYFFALPGLLGDPRFAGPGMAGWPARVSSFPWAVLGLVLACASLQPRRAFGDGWDDPWFSRRFDEHDGGDAEDKVG